MDQPNIVSTNPDYLIGLDGGHPVRVPVNGPDGQRANIGLSQAQVAAGATGVAGATSGTPGTLVMPGGEVRLTTPQYTWATLPDATSYIGNAFISDVGARGSLWRSDGSVWGIVGGHCVLAESAVAQTATTGTTSAQDRVTIAVPANLLGLNGSLEIVARWTVTNNANAKTATIVFGGSTVSSLGLASNATSSLQAILSNRNSASSQIGGNNNQVMSLSSSAWNTLTIDTSVAQNLVLREQLAVGTDSIQIQAYSVRLYRP